MSKTKTIEVCLAEESENMWCLLTKRVGDSWSVANWFPKKKCTLEKKTGHVYLLTAPCWLLEFKGILYDQKMTIELVGTNWVINSKFYPDLSDDERAFFERFVQAIHYCEIRTINDKKI